MTRSTVMNLVLQGQIAVVDDTQLRQGIGAARLPQDGFALGISSLDEVQRLALGREAAVVQAVVLRFAAIGDGHEIAGVVHQIFLPARKAQIKNLKNELSFNIPRQKEAAIEGDITLHFDLASRQEVLIDFREEREKIKEVIANGVPVDKVRFENEHIILPASSTVEGANGIRKNFKRK